MTVLQAGFLTNDSGGSVPTYLISDDVADLVNSLRLPSGRSGQMAYITTTGQFFINDGTAWVEF